MAVTKMNLQGILSLDPRRFIKATGQARNSQGQFIKQTKASMLSLRGLQNQFGKFKAGGAMFTSGARSATMGLAPLSVAMGLGLKKAADFEKQMSAVGAITRASVSDFDKLSTEAKRLGVVSVFSATESGQAMEFMGRAGANTEEIIAGLSGVMNAAAADSIDLATSADIISQVVRGMKMEMKEAGHVADTLALASMKTNTNIVGLGEAFTYGSGTARQLGISLEETTALFGSMANAGLKGSLSGTAFTNMMNKLTKPTAKAGKMIKQMGVSLTGPDKKMRKVSAIVADFTRELSKVKDTAKRAGMASEIFGIRGARAFSALSAAGADKIDELNTALLNSSFGMGAAAEAAEKRLDNLTGKLTLFKSSVEAASIEFFGPLMKEFTDGVADMTGGLNDVLFSLQKLKAMRGADSKAASQAANAQGKAMQEQFKLNETLGATAGARAQAGLSALHRMQLGEEKLTKAQRDARKRSFADFMTNATKRKGMTAGELEQRKKSIDEIVKRGTAENASMEDKILLQNNFAKAIGEEHAKKKKISDENGLMLAGEISGYMERSKEAAKYDAKARAILERQRLMNEIETEHGHTAKLVAEGVLEAIDSIKESFKQGVAWLKELGRKISESIGEDRLKGLVKFATIFATVAAAAVPLMLALGTITWAIKGIALMAGGLGSMLAAAFLPVTAILLIGFGILTAFRQENETIGETALRVWGNIKTFIMDVWNNALKPMWEGIRASFLPVIELLAETWTNAVDRIKTALSFLFDEANDGMGETSVNWQEVGATIMAIFGTVLDVAIKVFSGIIIAIIFAVKGIVKIFQFLWTILKWPFEQMGIGVAKVLDGITDLFGGNFLRGMAKIGLAIADAILMPLRGLAKIIATVADLAGFGENKMVKGIGKFADQGLTGFVFDTDPESNRKKTRGPGRYDKSTWTKQSGKTKAFDTGALPAVGDIMKQAGKDAADPAGATMRAHGLRGAEGRKTAERINAIKAEEKRKEKERQEKEVKVDVALEDNREVNVNNSMCVDGREVAKSSNKHKQSILERTGAKATPYQRRIAVENGA